MKALSSLTLISAVFHFFNLSTIICAVFDSRVPSILKVLIPTDLRHEVPECDPQLPTLSVGDVLIDSYDDIVKLKDQTSMFLIGIANSSDRDYGC